jgi:hypothetical protein
MAIQRVTFTEWTPDLPGVAENLSIAKNVVPTAIGYAPFPTAVDYSDAASENLNNVFAGRFAATTTVFAGGATKLFKYDSVDLSMDNVSKSGDYSGVQRWNFIQFGNTVIAANNLNKLQGFTLGSSTTFDDLAAAAPVAKYVTVVRDFVVCANLDSGTNGNKVQWSDINDESDWVSGATSQSDFQIIADGGNITGLTGGEFGLVLLERAIARMTYIGSPFFFQFDTISRGLGCIEGNSVTKYGNITYFLSDDGFYSCDGSNVIPIGTQKIDNWFFTNANPAKFDEMSATVDPIRKLVIWDFINTDGGRSILIYNWQVQKWSYADTDVDYINNIAAAGLVLEGLDDFYNVTAGSFVIGQQYTITALGSTDFTLIGAEVNVVGARFTATGVGTGTGEAIDLAAAAAAGRTLDTLETSLDDSLWSGGKFLSAGVRGAKVVTFTGANSVGLINTGDIGSEATTVITLARPIVDNGSANVAVASRTLLNQTPSFGAYVPASNENRVSLRSSGKYHRLSIVPTGDQWSNVLAIDIEITQQGTR